MMEVESSFAPCQYAGKQRVKPPYPPLAADLATNLAVYHRGLDLLLGSVVSGLHVIM